MGLIPAIIAGAGAIFGAAIVKVIADDAKEWTPWLTQRLLNIAVRSLPNVQRERYAEEWAAHLAEVPGVVGKLAISLQFQIAAFWAREMDARARLDAWQNERFAVLVRIKAMIRETLVLDLVKAQEPAAEADEGVAKERVQALRGACKEILRQCKQLDARRPALGFTMAGATLAAQHTLEWAHAKVVTKAGKWLRSTR